MKKITAMPLGLDFHTKSEKAPCGLRLIHVDVDLSQDVEVVPVELQERQLKAAQKVRDFQGLPGTSDFQQKRLEYT